MPGITRSKRWWIRPLTAAGATAALTLGLLVPAGVAAPPAPPPVAPGDPVTDPLLDPPVLPSGIAHGDGMDLWRTEEPVAPGTTLTTYQRLESDKWLAAQALSVDLTGGTQVDYLHSGTVANALPVSALAAAHDPGEGRSTVAAINADFFDINGTKAPIGPGVREGVLTHSASQGRTAAVGFGPDSAGRILDLYFDGTLTLPDGGREVLDVHNAVRVPAGGIGLYTPQWGTADRALPVSGSTEITEVMVEDGTVISVAGKAGSGEIPAGTAVLLGREAGAVTLAALTPGDRLDIEYAPRTADGSEVPRTAVGGNGVLVMDGEPQNWEGRPNNATAPRTAVGFSADGLEMHVLTVDGRQTHSGGTTLTELAVLMAGLGAHSALNLDGGGSTTLLAREPGGSEPRLVNSPSDGAEREVPNGLALTAPLGSGNVTGFHVRTAARPETAPTASAMPGGRPDRVFPGLTRQLTAAGHDETYGPAPADPVWESKSPRVGRVNADGVFTAISPGTTEVRAVQGPAHGGTELTVLGELERISPTVRRVGLADRGSTGTFGILGYDSAGHTAPIEPADVELDWDRSLFEIVPDTEKAGFAVTALSGQEFSSGTVTVTVSGRSTELAVTSGLEVHMTADFEDAADWRFDHARAAGSLSPTDDGRAGTALRMEYDFSRDTATRAAYAAPPADIPVRGRPRSFQLWLRGDGMGAWPSLHLKDASGVNQVLRSDHIDWEGWRKISFEVPEGLSHPLSVHRLYIAETRPDAQYTGQIVIDDLTAQIPPDVELPAAGRHADPVIGSGAQAAGRDWNFAVVSDAQFVARAPDSDIVRLARRTLREARAAGPDFVVINGDWVDEGSRADLEFARDMLAEELGELPWRYIPGNHEVMGGSIELFEEVFGPAQQTFDHRGTRFVTLDTSSLTIRGGGYGQFTELRRQLDAAASEPGIGSVVVMAHVPPRDTTAQPASRLTDRMEALLLETWLSDFRRETGKGAAFLGAHAGIFDGYRLDGVPYVIGGDAGKAPAAAPEDGGFTGWALVGVDRVGPQERARARRDPHLPLPDFLTVQTRAHVDGLYLEVPGSLAKGDRESGGAVLVQLAGDGVRRVPVRHPVSADWSGSPGLHIGSPETAGRGRVAAFDPVAGELTGLRAGTVTLSVEVNGERRQAEIEVTG